MRNKKDYSSIIIKNLSYLELWLMNKGISQSGTGLYEIESNWGKFTQERKFVVIGISEVSNDI